MSDPLRIGVLLTSGRCPEHGPGFRLRGFAGLPKDARNLAVEESS